MLLAAFKCIKSLTAIRLRLDDLLKLFIRFFKQLLRTTSINLQTVNPNWLGNLLPQLSDFFFQFVELFSCWLIHGDILSTAIQYYYNRVFSPCRASSISQVLAPAGKA